MRELSAWLVRLVLCLMIHYAKKVNDAFSIVICKVLCAFNVYFNGIGLAKL